MKVSIITVLYNEEMLAPFFLNHYSWADEIHVLLDADTTDRTADICNSYQNVTIEEFRFPDMMDAIIKQEHIHRVFSDMDTDWVFAVDCDEFVFPIICKDRIKPILKKIQGNVVCTHMWTVYRNRRDADLDPDVPVYEQRVCGESNMNIDDNAMYVKPCIAKPESEIVWMLGCHSYYPNPKIDLSTYRFQGAHWKMADPELAVIRRINGKKRQSQSNLSGKYQIQDHFITEEKILNKCEEHRNDPRLF